MTVNLASIRARAHQSAKTELARDVGSMVIGDDQSDAEADWCYRYLTYFVNAFAFFAALDRCDGNARRAAQLVCEREIRDEIAARVTCLMIQVAA